MNSKKWSIVSLFLTILSGFLAVTAETTMSAITSTICTGIWGMNSGIHISRLMG